jgi:hypothetical protein
VAQQRSKRKQRGTGTAPRAVRSERRQVRAQQEAATIRERQATTRQIRSPGGVGERPPGPFGGLPVSEVAIGVGLIGLIVGLLDGGGPAVLVGALVCAAGVLEVTAREHFTGFRSHCTILSAVPAVALEVLLVKIFGQPRQHALILVPVIPLFALCFWLLRKRFRTARQRRVVRSR